MGTQQSTDNFEDTLYSRIPVVHRQLQTQLRLLSFRLTTVRSVVSTVTLALLEQNGEIDKELACVLRRCAGDALGAEIERLDALYELLGRDFFAEKAALDAELEEGACCH